MTKAKGTALAETEPVRGEVTSLIELAINEKVPVEVLERLVALKERVEERDARVSYFRALSDFQAEVGAIPKTAAIRVTRSGTTETRSRYAPLDKIVEHVRPLLRTHGFIFSWDSVVRDNGNVCITCYLRHVEGHVESANFEFPQKDASAPGMNGVQVAGSARTYGERYSLIQVLGLTTADPDDDGNGGDEPGPITKEQADTILRMIDQTNSDYNKFCAFMGVAQVEEISASEYARAMAALEKKGAKP